MVNSDLIQDLLALQPIDPKVRETVGRAAEALTTEQKLLRALVHAVEHDATKRAIAAELGVTEWWAFVPEAIFPAFCAAREALGMDVLLAGERG